MNSNQNKLIVIVAGEASGDLHAAKLAAALKELSPQVCIEGVGGKKMQEAGVQLYYDIVDMAVVGLWEVLKDWNKFRKVFKGLLKKIDQKRPDCVVLVDYPGFNLRLARQLKKRNIPVIYYISPQVWAWGKDRIKLIKRCVDKMIVVFKFEEELYRNAGINVSFVGHPLLDVVRPNLTREELLSKFNIPKNSLIISILPGSRTTEIKRLFSIMLEAAEIICRNLKNVHFFVLKSPTVSRKVFQRSLKGTPIPMRIVENENYNCLNASEFAIVASGTATLETAIMNLPMVIVYKVSGLTYFLLKHLIKIPYIGLVNVVAGRKIVPEFLQHRARAENVAEETLSILESEERITQIKQELSQAKKKLGSTGASIRAAKQVLEFLH
jgi:lipid-A-disaccharide synthase